MKPSETTKAARARPGQGRLAGRLGLSFAVVGLLVAGDIGWRMQLKSRARSEVARIESDLQPLKTQLEALGTQLSTTDLTFFMRPQGLVEPEQVDAGKVAVARRRDLLAQRAQLFRDVLQHERALLALPKGAETGRGETAPPSPTDEQAVLAAMARADANSADAMQAVFDWAQNRLPELRKDRSAQAASQAQVELKALYERVNATDADDVHATNDAQAMLLAQDQRLQAQVRAMVRRAESPLIDQIRQWMSSRG